MHSNLISDIAVDTFNFFQLCFAAHRALDILLLITYVFLKVINIIRTKGIFLT